MEPGSLSAGAWCIRAMSNNPARPAYLTGLTPRNPSPPQPLPMARANTKAPKSESVCPVPPVNRTDYSWSAAFTRDTPGWTNCTFDAAEGHCAVDRDTLICTSNPGSIAWLLIRVFDLLLRQAYALVDGNWPAGIIS